MGIYEEKIDITHKQQKKDIEILPEMCKSLIESNQIRAVIKARDANQ